ncbi:MAG: hypothetical protein FWG73_03360 [Planctomycetaceae bacterium]|nr:hypothetical protein [Planctomycetaceae bacterium]
MARSRIVFVLFLSFFCYALVIADEAFDFYVEAVRHSAYNPAEISTFQAELKATTKIFYPDSMIEQFAEQVADSIEDTLKKIGADDVEIQKAREEQSESIRQTFSGWPNSKVINVFMKNSASPIGLEEARPQILEVEATIKRSSLFSSGLGVSSDEEKPSMLQYERSTTISTTSGGDAWFYTAGRMAPLVGVRDALRCLLSRDETGSFSISAAGIASFRMFCEANRWTFSLSAEREYYEGNHSAYVLQVYEGGRLSGRFLIDPDRGYICPQSQVFCSESGKVWKEMTAENFVFDALSQKWFPEKAVDTLWTRGTEGEEATVISEFYLVPGTLVLNQPIPDSVFALTVREGTRVDDARRNDLDQTTFIANKSGTLDLAVIEEKSLDDFEWLTPQDVLQHYAPFPIEHASFNWLQIVLTSVGIILIVVGITRLFLKRSEA